MRIFRPPDVVVGALMFYLDSIFFLFFTRQLSSELAEQTQPKPATCSKVCRFENACPNFGHVGTMLFCAVLLCILWMLNYLLYERIK